MQLACLSAIGSLDVPPNLGTSHAKTKIAIDSVECVNTHTPHTHTRTTHYTHLFTSTGVREATKYNVTLLHHFSHTVTALGTSIHNWFTLQVDKGRRVLLTKTCRGSYLHGQADIKFSLGKTQLLTNTTIWHSGSECTLTTHVNCNAKCPHTTPTQGAQTLLQHKVPRHYCNARCPHTTATQGAHTPLQCKVATPLQHKVPTHHCNARCPHTTAMQGGHTTATQHAHTLLQHMVPTHHCNARCPHTTAMQGAHTPLQCKVPTVPSFAVQDTTHTDTTHCCNTVTTSPYVCMNQNTSIRATVPSLASCSTPAPCIPP